MTAPRTGTETETATRSWRAWSCTIRLVVRRRGADRHAEAAAAQLAALMQQVEDAVSRFRPDSDLSRANARAGRPTPVSALTAEFVAVALSAAAETDGAVDPTVGRTLAALGYDRDITEVGEVPDSPVRNPVRDWRHVRLDRAIGGLTVPAGTALDLGATAKAYTADLAARRLAKVHGDVLVELGGDVAVAGAHDWAVRVAEAEGGAGQVVLLGRGGLTTSTTTLRRWQRGRTTAHHIVDPRTGLPATGPWRTATVHAASATAANTASTAAIVLGAAATRWLSARGRAARLVGQDGAVVTTAGWPSEIEAAA